MPTFKPQFKKGDVIVCVNDEPARFAYLEAGKEFTALEDSFRAVDGERVTIETGKKVGQFSYPVRNFKLKAEPVRKAKVVKQHEHVVESRFEVRLDQGFGYKAITRAPRTQQEAEDFITRNGGNYAAPGDKFSLDGGASPKFDIVHVEVIHREKRVRSVSRKYVPARHELVDA